MGAKITINDITIQDAISELKREIDVRRKEYPSKISMRTMNRDVAIKQFLSLQKALLLLDDKYRKQSFQPGLFD